MIVQSFKKLAVSRGGLLFFNPTDALTIVDELERVHVKVLGLDAFRVTDTQTQPFLEHSLDLSDHDASAWKEAKTFLEDRRESGFLYEIIADE